MEVPVRRAALHLIYGLMLGVLYQPSPLKGEETSDV
jgi:hypothetical protein